MGSLNASINRTFYENFRGLTNGVGINLLGFHWMEIHGNWMEPLSRHLPKLSCHICLQEWELVVISLWEIRWYMNFWYVLRDKVSDRCSLMMVARG